MSKSGNCSIFIGKLSSRIRDQDLEDEFSKYGKIKSIELKRHRGFAFIEYSHPEDAKEAIS